MRYRVRWGVPREIDPSMVDGPTFDAFLREEDEPGWCLLAPVGTQRRIAGQLVADWVVTGVFADWRDAMYEATKDPRYAPPDFPDTRAMDALLRAFGKPWRAVAHEARWAPLRVPAGSPPAWRCILRWPDEEPCYSATVDPYVRSVCRRVIGAES